MKFKKEVKHSVVYETDDEKAPVKSVYVNKDWLRRQGFGGQTGNAWPTSVELEVKAPVTA